MAQNLTAALVEARAAIAGKVFKGGRNSAQNYRFVGHEDVVEVARGALQAAGLTLTQVGVTYLQNVPCPTRNAPEAYAHLWQGEFHLDHTGGESKVLRYQATTQPNDKSAFVASTSLDRVALMRVLLLAGTADENPEHDSHDQRAPQGTIDAGRQVAQLNEAACQRALAEATKSPADGSVAAARHAVDMVAAGPAYTYAQHKAAYQYVIDEPSLACWLDGLKQFGLQGADRKEAWAMVVKRAGELGVDPGGLT